MDIRQEMEARKVCVVVPTYNNGRTVADVVRRIAAITPQIIVVIDGCTDDTREQLAQLKEIPLTLVDYAQNSVSFLTARPVFGTRPVAGRVRLGAGSFGTWQP